ncbi:MAG: hypothetical protein PVI81_00560 [Anaerolineales bacterium]
MSEFLGCDCNDVAFFPNPTTAINMIVRSLDLKPTDEILATNHAPGTMDRSWQSIGDQNEARSRRKAIPLPV